VPEGDTIFRTATTLRRWLVGREITGTRGPGAAALVGDRVTDVTAQGKHLLIRFASGRALHTHMRMTGQWHVYSAGDRWRRPGRQARLVLEAGDRLAVCFDAPVVEVLVAGAERIHPALASLGPDILAEPPDLDRIVALASRLPPGTPIGDVLLDQHVVAGIGNIYRCEALFLAGVEPTRPLGAVGAEHLRDALGHAAALMRPSAHRTGRPGPRWVYGRAGRPCRRCGTRICSARVGVGRRTAYWCPRCQV
jgi:endonuclease VIII